MSTCYVAMPFGRRRVGEQTVDFDHVFAEIVQPVLDEARLTGVRSDRALVGAATPEAIYRTVMASAMMIADLTGNDAAIHYQLGLRHLARPDGCLLMWADRGTLPLGLIGTVHLPYEVDDDGHVVGEEIDRMRDALRRAIVQVDATSPVYGFFTGLSTVFPAEIGAEPAFRPGLRGDGFRGTGDGTRSGTRGGGMRGDQELAGEVLRGGKFLYGDTDLAGEDYADDFEPVVDPDFGALELARLVIDPASLRSRDLEALLAKLEELRRVSDWDGIITAVVELGDVEGNDPRVLHRLALALNRRGREGDQERAVAILEMLVAEERADAESFKILGRIYRERGRGTDEKELHRQASDHYWRVFALQRWDIQSGVTAVIEALAAGEPLISLDPWVKDLRTAVERRFDSGPIGYWELASAFLFAVLEGDPDRAEVVFERMLALRPAVWMTEPTRRELETILRAEGVADVDDYEPYLDRLSATPRTPFLSTGG
ncbi:MAG: TRAFs-binding domain-containing protein [Acidobacteriota bacterium]